MKLIILDKNNNDIESFINLITQNEKCPDLIICYFTAEWCGPCKMIFPTVNNIADNNDHIKVIKIDVDVCEAISEYCEISCMPTFKFYKNNSIEPAHSFSGADTSELINTIKVLLNPSNELSNELNNNHSNELNNHSNELNNNHSNELNNNHSNELNNELNNDVQYYELNNNINDF